MRQLLSPATWQHYCSCVLRMEISNATFYKLLENRLQIDTVKSTWASHLLMLQCVCVCVTPDIYTLVPHDPVYCSTLVTPPRHNQKNRPEHATPTRWCSLVNLLTSSITRPQMKWSQHFRTPPRQLSPVVWRNNIKKFMMILQWCHVLYIVIHGWKNDIHNPNF